MGGSSTSTKHETTSNQIDPQLYGQYQANYGGAVDRLNSMGPYTGSLTAGFNPTQLQAQGVLSGIGTDPRYQNANNSIFNGVQGIVNNPAQASTYTAKGYDPALLANTDLTPYLNPYTNQVVDSTLSDLSHARDQQGVKDMQAATNAGSFQGAGTRMGVQNANTTNDYLRNVASTSANLRNAAFQSAQGAAMGDVNARNTAGQYNTGQYNAADQFNANARNNMAQFNTNAGFTGAGILDALNKGGLQMATQQGGLLSAVGDARQQQEQTGLTNNYNAYLQEFNRQLATQQALNQALGIIPIQQTTTSDGTSTTKSNPGLGGVLGAIGGLGLAAATGGTSLGLTGAMGGSGLLGGLMGGGGAAGGINGIFSTGGLFGPKYTGNGNGEF